MAPRRASSPDLLPPRRSPPLAAVAVIRAAAKVFGNLLKKTANEDQKVGVEIVRRAVEAPIKQISDNAGVDGAVIAQKVKESAETNFGYNALTHEYGDMLKMGDTEQVPWA